MFQTQLLTTLLASFLFLISPFSWCPCSCSRLWLADVFAVAIRFSYVPDFLDFASGFTSFPWYLDIACILPNAGVPAVAGVPASAGICTGAGALPPTAGVSAVSDVYAAADNHAQGKPLALQLLKTLKSSHNFGAILARFL